MVRHGDRFLLVQERKHGQLWYLPAGRAEPGETLFEAAVRETLEESGVRVRLTGIVRIEHTPYPEHARVRATFLAEPTDSPKPKDGPDEESLQARWVTLEELRTLPLRGQEVEWILRSVAEGGAVAPLTFLQQEGPS